MKLGPGKLRRYALSVAVVALAVVGAVAYGLRGEILPERSPFERGRRVAREAGCFACHDEGGGSGAPNLRLPKDALAAGAPGAAQAQVVPPLFCGDDDADGLRAWIRNGMSAADLAKPAHLDSLARTLIRMPAYAGRIAAADEDDLVAYILLERHREAAAQAAVGIDGAPPAGPISGETALARGERLARGLGCFACHGELGQGGVANRGALKGYIPGFFGRDFELLTDGARPDDVRAWVKAGAPARLLESTVLGVHLARAFTERQAIGMPAFARFARPEEIDALVEYCGALHRQGPMDVATFTRYLAEAKEGRP